MSDPTWSELTDQFSKCAVLLEKLRLATLSQSNHYVGLHDAAGQAQEGDYAIGPAIDAHRALVTGAIRDSAARALLAPTLRNMAKLVNSTKTDLPGIVADVYDYMQSIAVAAAGTLTMDTIPGDTDTIEMGSVTYTFKTTIASANDVYRGADVAAAKVNLVATILGTGTPGTTYYLGTASPHPDVKCPSAFTGDTLVVTAREKGTAGNALASVITATGSNAFDAVTLGTTTAGVQPYTLKTRAQSLGAIAANANNSGNNTIARCSLTKDGHAREGGWADTVTVECVTSGFGANGAQPAVFEIRGRNPGIDRGVERGAAAYESQQPLVTRMTEQFGSPYLLDPYFSQLSSANLADGDALTADPSGWTVTTGTSTNWKVSTGTPGTHYYRDVPGRTMRALDIYETFSIYTRLRGNIPLTTPHVARLIFKRENTATGTLRVRLGSLVKMVSVASTTDNTFGFVDLVMSSGICTRYAYPSEFSEFDATAKGIIARIDWVRGAGNIILCEFILQPMIKHDDQWYLPVPNNATLHVPARAAADGRDGDSWTFTNTETGAINQRWLHRGFRASWPSHASPSVSDGTVT